MSQHAEFHYSITVRTDDLAVLHCLRSLSQYAQKSGNKRIPWGGTKESDWNARDHCVTFHFTSTSYRRDFLAQIERLLPRNLWEKAGENDADPAMPQNGDW
jgi:hypothetical protein